VSSPQEECVRMTGERTDWWIKRRILRRARRKRRQTRRNPPATWAGPRRLLRFRLFWSSSG
jgi:hypothetical protein